MSKKEIDRGEAVSEIMNVAKKYADSPDELVILLTDSLICASKASGISVEGFKEFYKGLLIDSKYVDRVYKSCRSELTYEG